MILKILLTIEITLLWGSRLQPQEEKQNNKIVAHNHRVFIIQPYVQYMHHHWNHSNKGGAYCTCKTSHLQK